MSLAWVRLAGAARSAGTDAEFTAFVATHRLRLATMAELVAGDPHRGEDLLQAVLTRAYLRWSKIRQDDPLGYVQAGLINARTDWWRRRSSEERPTATLPDVRSSPDHSGQVAGRDAVQRALSVLTRRERVVIVLRYFEDLSVPEIAVTLGIAPGTVRNTCARALSKLRLAPDLADVGRTTDRYLPALRGGGPVPPAKLGAAPVESTGAADATGDHRPLTAG